MIKRIVMWRMAGSSPAEKAGHAERVRAAFAGLRISRHQVDCAVGA